MPSAMRRYEDELAEWRAVCAEMAAAEQAALSTHVPGTCELCCYWTQECAGLVIEVPCRVGAHGVCMAGAFVGCAASPPVPPECACDPGRAVWRHHASALQEYAWLARLLLENLCVRPQSPWYVYHAEVGLIRPPRPQPPRG